MKQYHINLDTNDVGKYVFLTGDPGRVPHIAKHLDDARETASNREFCTWTGYLCGTKVSVISTGIGGPSAAIVVEELSELGVHTLIRLGTCGFLQPNAQHGDLVIASACVRGGSTTNAYVPQTYPAVADRHVLRALEEAARARHIRHCVGIVQSKDAFFMEYPERLPLCEQTQQEWQIWKRANVAATDMESDTLFVLASLRNMRAGAMMCGLGGLDNLSEISPMTDSERDNLVQTALEALKRLFALDAENSGCF